MDPNLEASYYENRAPAYTYFIINGLLLTIMIYSLANAIQHPKLAESNLNVFFSLIIIVTSFSFDNWVLLKNSPVTYYTIEVNVLISILIIGYMVL